MYVMAYFYCYNIPQIRTPLPPPPKDAQNKMPDALNKLMIMASISGKAEKRKTRKKEKRKKQVFATQARLISGYSPKVEEAYDLISKRLECVKKRGKAV